MIPEIDIWRAAHLIIQQHRKDSAHQADARAGVSNVSGIGPPYDLFRRSPLSVVSYLASSDEPRSSSKDFR